jgi:hypothetical protein
MRQEKRKKTNLKGKKECQTAAHDNDNCFRQLPGYFNCFRALPGYFFTAANLLPRRTKSASMTCRTDHIQTRVARRCKLLLLCSHLGQLLTTWPKRSTASSTKGRFINIFMAVLSPFPRRIPSQHRLLSTNGDVISSGRPERRSRKVFLVHALFRVQHQFWDQKADMATKYCGFFWFCVRCHATRCRGVSKICHPMFFLFHCHFVSPCVHR